MKDFVDLNYHNGFGNEFESEACAGALPKGQNSPQKPPLGLYAEQINGTSFLAPRQDNLRTWCYRIHPSVHTSLSCKIEFENFLSKPFSPSYTAAQPYRFNTFIKNKQSQIGFLESIVTICGNGGQDSFDGSSVHLYGFNNYNDTQFFCNNDGDFLFVPYQGAVEIATELGHLRVSPGQIAVIPRGIVYNVKNLDDFCAGYILENYGLHFRLPYLGPIGSNGLANPRDFQYPIAKFYDKRGNYSIITKLAAQFFQRELDYNPLNVVAYHGNYLPYKYCLSLFNTINTVSFDHCDPSIFTVLTSPSTINTFSNCDFVIFPPRWMVSERSFRPPYYHKNFMSEFMGLIEGVYDAKENDFVIGGFSIHNRFVPHGPDKQAFLKATNSELKPQYLANTMAFMFESSNPYYLTAKAASSSDLQKNYIDCWKNLPYNFKI